MDPFSQGLLGASLSQSLSKKSELKIASLIGLLSGMAADLDVFLLLHLDRLLRLAYHRHFTHSIFFIPIGALFVSIILHLFLKNKISFKKNYFYSFFAYATHGLLDACTSYGTNLYWPVSNIRVSWDIISIIDPLFTIPVIFLIIFSLKRKSVLLSRFAFLWCLIALGFGFFQKMRSYNLIQIKLSERQHKAEKILVKPTGFNTLKWRTVYEYQGRYYVDGIVNKVSSSFIEGSSIKKLELGSLKLKGKQLEGAEIFRWFANDWIALYPNNLNLIMDVRYGYPFASLVPLWGIEIDFASEDYPKYRNFIRERL